MKTTRRLLIISALLLLGAYSIYTTVRIQQLENRLLREQISRPTGSQITYAFDDSFREYFGEQGVAAVERAMQILRSPRTAPAPKIEKVDLGFLTEPLRLDGREE